MRHDSFAAEHLLPNGLQLVNEIAASASAILQPQPMWRSVADDSDTDDSAWLGCW